LMRWIYQIRNRKPYITYLAEECSLKVNDIEREMVEKITNILTDNGYSDIVYNFRTNDSYHF
jgi:hypothetical protein